MSRNGHVARALGALRRALHRCRAATTGAQAAGPEHARRPGSLAPGTDGHAERSKLRIGARLPAPNPAFRVPGAPHAAHWAWQPDLWRIPVNASALTNVANGTRLGTELGIFHDCPNGAVSLQQFPNRADGANSAHAARIDVTDFEGSFLSLAIDLPAASLRDLRTTHVIRVDGLLHMDEPVKTFVRLNVRHGINVEQRVRAILPEAGRFMAAFDFIDCPYDVEHAGKAWIDIIFGQPRRNAITLSDLQLSRFRRAEI